jgi:hypothetical protein
MYDLLRVVLGYFSYFVTGTILSSEIPFEENPPDELIPPYHGPVDPPNDRHNT